jgi:hypothetical protein
MLGMFSAAEAADLYSTIRRLQDISVGIVDPELSSKT